MRLYSPVDLTGNLIMIEKLVLSGTWTGDPNALYIYPLLMSHMWRIARVIGHVMCRIIFQTRLYIPIYTRLPTIRVQLCCIYILCMCDPTNLKFILTMTEVRRTVGRHNAAQKPAIEWRLVLDTAV